MNRRLWGIVLGAVLLTALMEAGLRRHLVNHDVAQFMYGAGQMLDGQTLYRDFIEMNLPTTYWVSALPVLAGRLAGLAPASALLLVVMTLVAVSLGLCALVLNRSGTDRGPELLLLLLTVEVLPAFQHFGQREHLLVILALPYALTFVMAGRSPRLAIAAGALAGVGMSLKPHFFLLPLFLEAAAMAHRRVHAQTLVAVAVGGGILGAALWRHQEYVTELLPLARATYGGWEASLATFLRIEGLSSSALALWLGARLSLASRPSRVHMVAAAATAAGIAMAAMQNKGYDYHMLPATVSAALLLAVVVAEWGKAPPSVAAKSVQAAPALLLVVFLLSWDCVRFLRDSREPFDYADTIERMAPVVERWGGATPIAGLSIHVFPAFPYLARYGGEWGLRYPSLWPLLGYFKFGGGEPGPHLVNLRTRVAADLAAKRPCIIFVDTWIWGDAKMPLLDFMYQDAQFSTLWQSYRPVASIDGYDFYSRCAAEADGGLPRHIP